MKQNEKAFPLVDTTDGMDLRDYFAAKAIQGTLANPNSTDKEGTWLIDEKLMARDAYAIADAMMKAREV